MLEHMFSFADAQTSLDVVDVPPGYVVVVMPADRLAALRALDAERPPTPSDPTHGDDLDGAGGWTEKDLAELIGDPTMPEKQVTVLELLAERSPDTVYASQLRERLVERGLLSSAYPGKALGGIVRCLQLRARRYHEEPLFARDWDYDRWETWYRLAPPHRAVVLAAVAHKREIAEAA
jgi:hypothetical protein